MKGEWSFLFGGNPFFFYIGKSSVIKLERFTFIWYDINDSEPAALGIICFDSVSIYSGAREKQSSTGLCEGANG